MREVCILPSGSVDPARQQLPGGAWQGCSASWSHLRTMQPETGFWRRREVSLLDILAQGGWQQERELTTAGWWALEGWGVLTGVLLCRGGGLGLLFSGMWVCPVTVTRKHSTGTSFLRWRCSQVARHSKLSSTTSRSHGPGQVRALPRFSHL